MDLMACLNLQPIGFQLVSDRLQTGKMQLGYIGIAWKHITFASANQANKVEPTLALKPTGDVTKNPMVPVAPK